MAASERPRERRRRIAYFHGRPPFRPHSIPIREICTSGATRGEGPLGTHGILGDPPLLYRWKVFSGQGILLLDPPFLVVAAVTLPLMDIVAVVATDASHVEAQAAVSGNQSVIPIPFGNHPPDLVVPAVAFPLLDIIAVPATGAGHVEALAAMQRHQGMEVAPPEHEAPFLVVAAVTLPLMDIVAVVATDASHVEALAAVTCLEGANTSQGAFGETYRTAALSQFQGADVLGRLGKGDGLTGSVAINDSQVVSMAHACGSQRETGQGEKQLFHARLLSWERPAKGWPRLIMCFLISPSKCLSSPSGDPTALRARAQKAQFR